MTLLGIREIPIRTIVDIGANRGQFARHIRAIFPDVTLICFEPLSGPFEELQAWAVGERSIHLFNCALGSSVGQEKMYMHSDHDASSSLLVTTALTERLYPETQAKEMVIVEVQTLDSVMKEISDHVKDDLLIKIDVQGFEAAVLDGGIESFSRARACIVEVSLDALYDGQPSFLDLVTKFHEMGLRYSGNLRQYFGDDGHVIFLDAVFIRY